MLKRIYRLMLVILLSQSLIYTPFIYADQLPLPSGDLEAPEVIHEMNAEDLPAGTSQNIKATVTDNVGIKVVTLFYRAIGATSYKRINMQREGKSDVYSTTIGNNELHAPGIEYYIQAVDLAGNSLLHGYSFSPLKLTVKEAAQANIAKAETTQVETSQTPSESQSTTPSKKEVLIEDDSKQKPNYMKWVYIGLGVLVVGALASGGGGGGSDEGTVTVSAPTP